MRCANENSSPNWSSKRFPRCRNWPVTPAVKCRVSNRFRQHFSLAQPPVTEICSVPRLHLSAWRRQPRDLAQHVAKGPARQMALREQQPVVAGVLDQAAAGFHQALLQAGVITRKGKYAALGTIFL